MNAEQLSAIKERMPKRDDIVDWSVAQTMILEDTPALVAEVERLKDENNSLKRSLEYIAPRKSNPDWTIAHNALAVWGRSE